MDRHGGTARKVHEFVRRGEYDEAIRIAERLNYDKVSNLMLVMDVATAYDALGDREEAKEVLTRYYNNKGGKNRNLMEFLIELCILTDDVDNAVKYCLEFEEKWPDDAISLVMRYRIISAADGSLAEQAKYLEQYKKLDFDERWGYELAEVYYRAKQVEPCVQACHDLILYFGKGEYVERAAKMKNYLVGLSPDEVEVLRRFYPGFDEPKEEPEEEVTEEQMREAETEEEYPETLEEEIETAQAGYEFQAETDEELVKVKSQYYVDEKLKQTEELAKQRKLKEQQEEEKRKAQAEKEAQVREDMISTTLHRDYYEEVEENRKKVKPRTNIKPIVFTGKDLQATVNELLANFRRTLSEEIGDSDVEYITVGRNSESYAEAIEERIRSEITMLSEEQVRELNPNQVKELYELTILHDVNGKIAAMVKASMANLPDVDMAVVNEEMDRFIREDALNTLVNEMNAREEARLQAEEQKRLEEEAARKQAEAEAEARARAANIAKMEEEARRKRAEAQIQEALAAQEAAMRDLEAEVEALDGMEDVSDQYVEAGAVDETDLGQVPLEEAVEPEVAGENASEGELSEEDVDEKFKDFFIEDPEEEEQEASALVDADSSQEVEETVPDTSAAKEASPVVKPLEEVVQEMHTILDEIQNPNEMLTADTFQACVVARAKTQGYSVDERAYMTIQILCDEILEEGVNLSMNLAIALTDAAIVRCTKGTGIGKLFKSFSKKQSTVLKDRHFDWDDNLLNSVRTDAGPEENKDLPADNTEE